MSAAGILLAALLAGCGQNAGSQPASDSAQPTVTERVPVVDTQYEKILDGYDVVGSFHNGVAFAARYLVTSGEDYTMKGDLPPVECGYITLEGEYTPLYVVPNEIELLGPAEGRANLHGSVDDIFLNTEEGMELYFGGGEASIQSAPSMVQQKALDDIFLVGDNGWVPYFENDKWGYTDREYKNVRIDRAGMVVDCQDGTWEDAQNVPYERGVEIKQQVYRALIRKPFLIQEQSGHTGETLLLPSGQPVSRPEGVQFGYGLVQCDDRYAFVEADTTGKEFFSNETEYVLVDAAGRVYTEWKQGWDYVYPVEGGTAYGVKTVYDGQGGVDRYELTPLTVTVSRG